MMKRVCLLLCLVLLSACSSLWDERQRSGSSSSLVEFLYPAGSPVEHKATVPAQLQLPLRVGLAWVPATHHGDSLAQADQQRLLSRVGEHFSERPYVERVEIIPDHYLRNHQGFDALRQLGRLYDLDAIALVSHDQLLQSDERELSLLYWTIVGAYVVPGTKNSVNTFVDTAVFDLDSGRLLFRAPGVDAAGKRSNAVEAQVTRDQLSSRSFGRAFDDMVTQLDQQLDDFAERARSGRSDVSISYRQGYGGSGSVDWPILLVLLFGWFAWAGVRRYRLVWNVSNCR